MNVSLRGPLLPLISAVVLGMAVLQTSVAAAAPTTFSTYVASPSIGWSEGIAVDASGNLFIASYFNSTVFEEPSGGGALVPVATIAGNNIKGLAVDAMGNLFIGAQNSGYIYEESAATIQAQLNATPANGLVHVASSPNSEIGGIAVDANGNLLFASGGFVFCVSSATLANPSNLPATFGNAGLVWITNFTTALGFAEDVAVTPTGDLLVAANSGRVVDISSGALGAAIAGTPVGSSSLRVVADQPTSGLRSPIGVKVDAAGDVFIGDDTTGFIYEANAADVAGALASGTPLAASSMLQLTTITPMGMQFAGLAIGPSGLLYVGNGNNDVIRVSSSAFASPATLTNLVLSTSVNSVTASWSTSGTGAQSYVCTLMYGFNLPSSFQTLSTTNWCTFSNLSASTEYGVRVAPEFGGGTSLPVFAFSSTQAVLTNPVVKHRTALHKRAILCTKGSSRRWIAAVHPHCPVGYTQHR